MTSKRSNVRVKSDVALVYENIFFADFDITIEKNEFKIGINSEITKSDNM